MSEQVLRIIVEGVDEPQLGRLRRDLRDAILNTGPDVTVRGGGGDPEDQSAMSPVFEVIAASAHVLGGVYYALHLWKKANRTARLRLTRADGTAVNLDDVAPKPA